MSFEKIYTSDEEYFGKNVWVYCTQHMRPHLTGWCTVSNRNKVKLDAQDGSSAYVECKLRGLHQSKI